jgi:hypothetical protein
MLQNDLSALKEHSTKSTFEIKMEEKGPFVFENLHVEDNRSGLNYTNIL